MIILIIKQTIWQFSCIGFYQLQKLLKFWKLVKKL